jgi:hypothetical protein
MQLDSQYVNHLKGLHCRGKELSVFNEALRSCNNKSPMLSASYNFRKAPEAARRQEREKCVYPKRKPGTSGWVMNATERGSEERGNRR